MATYQLKKEEYLNYYKSAHGSKKFKIIRFWLIFIIIVTVSFYFEQYLFSGFLILAAIILSYLMKIKLTEESRYDNNPFLNSKIQLELYEESFNIKVKENELILSVKEIGKVEDLKEHYRIDHKCGNELIIPKESLDENELKQMKIYRRKKPANKWKIPMW